MIPAAFEYARPGSLDEALRLLHDREGEAKVLAGGYSLIPLLRYRLAQPGILVDIGNLADLAYIREVGGELRIGARTTHHQLEQSDLVARSGLWSDAAGGIGDPQVRNWGTLGGIRGPRGPVVGLARGPAGQPRVRRGPRPGARAGRSRPASSSSTRSSRPSSRPRS